MKADAFVAAVDDFVAELQQEPITCARQGDKDWHKLEVVEGDDVRPMAEVLEVNASEGWCRRWMRGPDGKLLTNRGSLVEEFVEGAFTIRSAK